MITAIKISDLIDQEFGGPILKKSHAKLRRPISKNKTMYFVFRSEQAVGRLSFLRKSNRRAIQSLLRRHKYLIRLQNLSIQQGQIQILLKIKTRKDTIKFLRVFTGLIARKLTGGEKIGRARRRITFGNHAHSR